MMCFFLNTNRTNFTNLASRYALAGCSAVTKTKTITKTLATQCIPIRMVVIVNVIVNVK